MTTTSIKFKTMLFRYDRDTRMQVLDSLKEWMMHQTSVDPNANGCYLAIQEMYHVNSWASDKDFKIHSLWFNIRNYDSCISFQEIVKSKLTIPKTNISIAVKNVNTLPRKSIPKKIRGEAWSNQFGMSMSGACYCCKKPLNAFDDWHAGHIISHSNGGNDTASNLRPVCGSCNLSMGTENMNDFKARCYPG